MAKPTPEDSAAGEAPKVRKRGPRKPIKCIVLLEVIDSGGLSVGLPAGHKLKVTAVERDLLKFYEETLTDNTDVGLFVRVDVPFNGS